MTDDPCPCLHCRLIDAIREHFDGDIADAFEVADACIGVLSQVAEQLDRPDRQELARRLIAGTIGRRNRAAPGVRH